MHTTAPSDHATGEQPHPRPTPTDGPAAPYRLRTASRWLLALHLLLLGWLSLRPVPAAWTSPPNLTPFASVHQALSLGGLAAVRQLGSGLLPLAPIGVLLPLAVGSPARSRLASFLRTTAAAALLGTALEILEGWAPGHVLDVDDILLGTLGAAAAHLLLIPPLRALEHRRPAAPTATARAAEPPVPAPERAEGRSETRPRPVAPALSVLGSPAAPRG
ncbi:VanZ family protein [Kitasatospora sp. NA04385]|uniref:VanZ family protein n=1 Tax=Kitasatospora sp. NA04385 TaxID=2742135 RepID=UPI001591E52C|nr:VanZ family protein [Kitasatospora sp. NA04385]QKW19863.1 VanZ family protein [Kitasatospora sp. NA04385]